MKNPKISFRVIGDSGPLTISWFDGPKGDAVEATQGSGVGFFSSDGSLLCVEFDDVKKKLDHQRLEFEDCQISVKVRNGKVSHSVTPTGGRSPKLLKASELDALFDEGGPILQFAQGGVLRGSKKSGKPQPRKKKKAG